MNQISPARRKRCQKALAAAFAEGCSRRQACEKAKLNHATFYRWLGADECFHAWVTALELKYAEKRRWRRWWTHPFRGKRPPRAAGDNASYPFPRYDLPPWFRYQDAYTRRNARRNGAL